jgi:hypothetical protein
MQAPKPDAQQKALPLEKPPKVALYALLTDRHLVIETSSKLAQRLGWGVTFVSDKEAAMRQREIIPLPLSTVKKLMRRCRPHWYDKIYYVSWRNHPCGFKGEEPTSIVESDGLLAIMRNEL